MGYLQVAKAVLDLRSLARSHTEMGIQVLAGIARKGKSESARVTAVGLLLERGWGKAAQPLVGEDGGPLRVVIRQIIENIDESAMKTIDHEPAQLEPGSDPSQGDER